MSRLLVIHRWGWLALCASLVACGGSDSAPPQAAAPADPAPAVEAPAALAAPPADLFTRAANPVTLSVSTTTSAAATATIGRSGGSIKATGADGTGYELVVPANALAQDTVITMTPIASTTGAPWTRALGVQLEPAGLQFYDFAQLNIEPAPGAALPVQQQVAVGAADNGDFFFAIPGKGQATSVRLLHFSSYWISAMTREQLDAARVRLPRLAELALEHEIAARLNVARQRELLGEDADIDYDEIFGGELYQQWLDAVMLPAIRSARDCVGYKRVISLSLGVQRQKALLGAPPEDSDDTATTTLQNLGSQAAQAVSDGVPFGNVTQAGRYACAAEASRQCEQRGLFNLLNVALGSEREAQLLGQGLLGTPFERDYLKYGDRIDACYRFNLNLESSLTILGTPGAREATTAVSATLDGYRPLQGYVVGQELEKVSTATPLNNTALDITPPSCGSASNLARGGGNVTMSFGFQPGVSGRPSSAEMELTLGNTTEAWTVIGCGAGNVRYGPQPLWTDAFMAAHAGETFEFPGFSRGVTLRFDQSHLPLNGTTLLDRTWSGTVGRTVENTRLRVTHAPIPFTEPTLP